MTDAREWPATAAAEKTVGAVRSANALRDALAAHAQQVTAAITDAGTRAVAGLALGQVFAGEADVARAMLRALDDAALHQVAATASDLSMLAYDLTPEGRDAEQTSRETRDADTGRAVAEIHVASIMRLAYLGRQHDVARAIAELTPDERERLVAGMEVLYIAMHDTGRPAAVPDPGVNCVDCPPGAPALVWRSWAGNGGGWAHVAGTPGDGHLPRPLLPGDEVPLVGFGAPPRDTEQPIGGSE